MLDVKLASSVLGNWVVGLEVRLDACRLPSDADIEGIELALSVAFSSPMLCEDIVFFNVEIAEDRVAEDSVVEELAALVSTLVLCEDVGVLEILSVAGRVDADVEGFTLIESVFALFEAT